MRGSSSSGDVGADPTVGAAAQQRPRTKVAVLVGALEVGGAELDIVRNFPRLNREEFEVVVVCFGSRGPLAPELERQGVRVISRGVSAPRMANSWVVRRMRSVAYTLTLIPWIGRTLNAEKADIVHYFLPHSYGYGMLACIAMRPKAKRVMSRLSLNFYKDLHRILSWLERHLFHRYVDIAIGNSILILDELVAEGVDRAKVRLLYNGVDPEPFARQEGDRLVAREALDVDADAFVIVAVGNLHLYKGHRDLIEACARIQDRLPAHWRLLIAGRDEAGNRGVLDAVASQLGLGEHVRLLGACDNVPQLLFAADVFAHPSHHEGLPNAIIEAMAASLPVVATSVGGIPEVVIPTGDPDETGWLVAPRDLSALATVLAEAAENPNRRQVMGARARNRVQARFSLEASVAAYEAIYRELVPQAAD